ncbi:MAG TPA: hypoxanthine phosphoribosyltransferase [Anaerolineaceae bacterium]|nr:hypoxanthine phosphoribosyltransferase [Anaerolineaceae bacterium]
MSNVDLNAQYGDLAADIKEIVLSEEVIQERIRQLGKQISKDYAGKNPLVVGVLKGVLFFMADLLRTLQFPVEVDFLAVSSYSPQARKMGMVRLVKDLDAWIEDRHVLFIEDVIDTGLTLNYLLRTLRTRQPASLEVCVLFDKPQKRLIEIPVKYKGFDLPDRFVVGYGLDYREKYRNLPFVGLLKTEAL